MAARLEPAHIPDIIDLRHLRSADMEALLTEEIETWNRTLDWDFSKSADLVRRFVDLRALNGCALVKGRQALGYAYYVQEEHKGLVGDLFVRREFAGVENENRLLEWALGALVDSAYVRRIESQLMTLEHSRERPVPLARYATAFERNFMSVDLEGRRFPAGAVRRPCYLEKWSEQYQEQAAQLIATAYVGHVDSRINDQYRTVAGARRFLYNIVQYPGCGAFFKPGSVAAFDAATGRVCGLCLASIVAPGAGHITQICVSPAVKGAGIGYELLRSSLDAMRSHGCTRVSLTVTAANREAVDLYERVGFQTLRKFAAYVWEGF